MNLHPFIDHVTQSFGGENLDQRRFNRELLRRLEQRAATVNVPRHPVQHAFARVHADGHLGQLVLDQAELGDRLAEGLPVARIANGKRERLAATALGECSQHQTAKVEDVEGDDVATPDLTQHVFHRHPHVVEIDGSSGAAFETHLLFFSSRRDAGPGPLD